MNCHLLAIGRGDEYMLNFMFVSNAANRKPMNVVRQLKKLTDKLIIYEAGK